MNRDRQPRIPRGVLTSKPARKIGPALALLGYAYDQVGPDGRTLVNLRVFAHITGIPYATAQRWWRAVEATPFFTEVQHTPDGMLARFADEVLAWPD